MKFFDVLLKQKLSVPIYKSKIDAEYFETLFAERLGGGSGPKYVTITGNPLSFTTRKAQTAISTKISMNPIQEGTGDPSPTNIRPITGRTSVSLNGCGTNLFDKDTCVFIPAKYISGTGEIESNGSYSYCETYIPVKPLTDYVFSGDIVSSITTNSVAFYDESKNFISRFQPSKGENAQFTTPENTRYLRFNVGKLAYDIDTIQIEEGSSASAYESYQQSNEITISFPALGKNLFNKATVTPSVYFDADGNIQSVANSSISDYIEVLPNVTYYFSQSFTQNVARYFCYYDANKNFLDTFHPNYNGEAITMPSNVKYIRASIRNQFVDTFQVEKGSSASAYEPYTNTCYGGTLDVETGVLTVSWAYIASYNGESITEPWISSIDKYIPNTSPSNGAEVAYTLATTTIQLTPSEVQLLKGVNNLWTDGDSIELTYDKSNSAS